MKTQAIFRVKLAFIGVGIGKGEDYAIMQIRKSQEQDGCSSQSGRLLDRLPAVQ
jgi:hypothetical protein